MSDDTVHLNHDYAACIQSANHFGYTLYANVCDGSQHIVQWGGADWLGFVGLAAAGIAAGIMVFVMLIMLLFMVMDF